MTDRKMIEKVAEVAKIRLTNEEIVKFSKDMKEILETFDVLKHVNTDGVKPTFRPIEVKNTMRKDVVKPGLSQKEALSNAKEKEKGYFKGPRAV